MAQDAAVAVTPEVGSPVAEEVTADAGTECTAIACGGAGSTTPPEPPAKPKPRPSAHYLWAALMARIYEVFPLIIIAFITFNADIQKILEHIGVEPDAPRITPARGPPLWDECGAQEIGEGVKSEPDWDTANQSPPGYSDDQRTAW